MHATMNREPIPAVSIEQRRTLLHSSIVAACRQSLTGRIVGTLDALSQRIGVTIGIADLNALLLSGRIVYGLGVRSEFVVRALEGGRVEEMA